MFSVDLSTREWDGHVVVALSGELDLVDAADVGAALDDFSVHASVEGAAASARRSRRVVVPLRRLHRRAGRIPSCSQGRHPPERSAVAHGSRPERQERHSLTAASRSR